MQTNVARHYITINHIAILSSTNLEANLENFTRFSIGATARAVYEPARAAVLKKCKSSASRALRAQLFSQLASRAFFDKMSFRLELARAGSLQPVESISLHSQRFVSN